MGFVFYRYFCIDIFVFIGYNEHNKKNHQRWRECFYENHIFCRENL